MLIIHGDNTIKSRDLLAEKIDQARAQELEIHREEAKELSEASLESLLGAESLFGTDKLIIIEGLHSLPRSKKKDRLIELIAHSEKENIILWEKRALTPTMIKKFPKCQETAFNQSKYTFQWLEHLGSQDKKTTLSLLKNGVAVDGDYFCFIMLIRHLSLLIKAKTNGSLVGAPFYLQKIRTQAREFSLQKLLSIHQKLHQIDQRQKASQSPIDLATELDLLTISL